MEEIIDKIQCSNVNCLAFNPLENNFCHQCGTPLVRNYLYGLDQGIKSYNVGDVIGDRYIVQNNHIILDSKPGLSPELTEDIPLDLVPYLKLFPYRLHIPQIYGFVTLSKEQKIWFLEYATTTHQSPPQFPTLTEMWPNASALRQLHWLWQLASLWQPLVDERVAETLIKPSLILVQDSVIKIKELLFNNKQKTPLRFLGHFWSTLIPTANPSIKNLLKSICQAITERKIIDSKELVKILDQVISEYSKTREYHYQICAYTDVGKIRENNEDSCYPNSASCLKIEPNHQGFAIVCDGIGGHEGGEVASQMAIAFLEEELAKIPISEEKLTPQQIQDYIHQLVCQINDLISERNNSEQRFQQRQRMGTTIVLSFINNHEIYIIHVGDSRIYWINQHNCQQITVDDDLASRQVRLGYSIYRDSLLYPGSGALIQALGMNPSISLYPTSQRYLIEEDSVFLLCSDGLSDFDRVEQYWRQEILPILTEKKDIAAVGQRLIEIANQTNGHDNITVALVYCQIRSKPESNNITFHFEKLISELENLPIQEEEILLYPDDIEKDTQPEQLLDETKKITTRKRKKRQSLSNIDLVFIILIILGSFYLVYAWIIEPILKGIFQPENNLTIGQIIKTKNEILLYPHPSSENNPNDLDGVAEIPTGTILQIVDANQESFSLNLKVCKTYLGDANSLSLPLGESGWIKTENIINQIDPNFQVSTFEEEWCNYALDLKAGDVIKITEPVIISGEESIEIKPETFLKIREVSENHLSISFDICHLPPNDGNSKFIGKTAIVSTQNLINKFEKIDLANNSGLENTSCYIDNNIIDENLNKEQLPSNNN